MDSTKTVLSNSILIISSTFYPQNSPRAFRATELAKEFARRGKDVKVITPRISKVHDLFEKEYKLTIKDLGKMRWLAISLHGNGLTFFIRRVIRRFSKLLIEYPDIQLVNLVKRALENERKFDMLVSIATPHPIHWGVAWALCKNKDIVKTWVADCGDPYMHQENDTFKKPFYFKYVEKWFMSKADFITVPTIGAIDGYYPEFKTKIKVIPQGFKFEDVLAKNKLNKNSFPEFAYAGMFIPGRRDPTEFLKYLISSEMEYRFHIYTKTPLLAIPYVEKSSGKIIIHSPIPRADLLYELSGMDFVVNFENVGSKQTPSKLIDYAIINKPILSIETGQLNKSIVNQFLNGQYGNRLYIEKDQYRIEKIVSKFLQFTS